MRKLLLFTKLIPIWLEKSEKKAIKCRLKHSVLTNWSVRWDWHCSRLIAAVNLILVWYKAVVKEQPMIPGLSRLSCTVSFQNNQSWLSPTFSIVVLGNIWLFAIFLYPLHRMSLSWLLATSLDFSMFCEWWIFWVLFPHNISWLQV